MLTDASQTDSQTFDALVGRIFLIEDTTIGTQKLGYLMRYRGKLRQADSAAAYDRLAADLLPLKVTPLFRWDGDRQSILLIPGLPTPKPSNQNINLVLFILTLLSLLLTGGLYATQEALPADWLQAAWVLLRNGWPFALSMIAILGTHELGHYFAGRYHGVHVTLPYFIPLPFSPFGTMGAFINMKEPPKNRNILLDIGVAGPLAGLVIAIPVLFLGLSMSRLDVLPSHLANQTTLQMEGNSIFYLLAKLLMFGKLLPAPLSYGNLPPLLYWLRYFFTGLPFPYGGLDVMLSPVAWAGWAGLLVTALNLIPAGQLDGGHLLFVLAGKRRAIRILPIILILMAILGFFWNTWWLWVAIILLLGRRYAEPLDEITPLDGRRKALAVLALVIFVLIFIPIPLTFI
jgi:membrane-associated protease RseP (regulator of RpoE activity)